MGDPKETIGHHGQELPVRWCFSKGTVRGQALPVALFPVRSSQRGHAAPLTATGPARLSLLPLKRPFYPILTRDALYVPCLFILAGDALLFSLYSVIGRFPFFVATALEIRFL